MENCEIKPNEEHSARLELIVLKQSYKNKKNEIESKNLYPSFLDYEKSILEFQ